MYKNVGIILIVENDCVYARTTANWLRNHGMNVRYVLSIDAAKLFLCKNEVGMVLSGFQIGGNNGMELLE